MTRARSKQPDRVWNKIDSRVVVLLTMSKDFCEAPLMVVIPFKLYNFTSVAYYFLVYAGIIEVILQGEQHERRRLLSKSCKSRI